VDGAVLPVEIKFRKRIDAEDLLGLRLFAERFGNALSVIVTRDLSRWDAHNRFLFIPLENFLLAF